MNGIKWGIIGCGDVTEIKSGPAFSKVRDSELVAVMRRDGRKAKDYAERHRVPRWYDNADLLINNPEINAVYIATPPLYHEEYTVAALQAGKHVYVEKPMTIDAAGAGRIVQAVENNNLAKLSVAHYRRAQPLFKKVKQLLDNGAIGKIKFINMRLLQPHQSKMIAQTPENWRIDPVVSGGGLFHDLAPHQIDLMVHFFGPGNGIAGKAFNQAGFYPADDLVSGTLVFKDKILFSGIWCFTVPESETTDICEIIGSEGSIRFSCFQKQQILVNRNGKEEVLLFDPLQHVQQPMIEKVVEYFLEKGTNPCSAEEGLHVMELMDHFTKKERTV